MFSGLPPKADLGPGEPERVRDEYSVASVIMLQLRSAVAV